MRRIGIMIGSDNDLKQCLQGLELLKKAEENGNAKVVCIITNSIHRNTEEVLENLIMYTPAIDVWIIGAGAANHLTGTCDAYLRYELGNDTVPVIGVAFEDEKNPENNLAARLSITQVPDTQVIYNVHKIIGEEDFYSACSRALSGNWPRLKVKKTKPVIIRTLNEALIEAQKRRGQ